MYNQVYKVKIKRSIRYFADIKMSRYLNNLSSTYNFRRQQKLAVFANDYIGIQINQFGVYEKEELEILFEFLAPIGNVFSQCSALDIGANIGNHSIYFSKFFKEVHSFEPNPFTFELLSLNSKWSCNVLAYNFGLGDEKGEFTMIEQPNNMGGASLRRDHQEAGKGVSVAIERLDGLQSKFGDIKFMKIDVEGFEANVLRGAESTINKYQPVIVLEQQHSEFSGNTSESISFLMKLGYRFCWYENGSNNKNWFVRRAINLMELVFGKSHRIISGEFVPAKTHSMLIAVPRCYQRKLGIN